MLSETHSQERRPTIDLAGSVNDVAEDFVHHELDPLDSRTLRESVVINKRGAPTHEDDDEDEFRIPGGLDPIRTREKSEPASADHIEEDEVSLLSSLTERLLSRLRVNIIDTTVTIIHEDHSQLTIRIPDIQFSTEDTLESISIPHSKPPASTHPTPSSNLASSPSQTSETLQVDTATQIRTAVTRTIGIAPLSIQMQLVTRPSQPREARRETRHRADFGSQTFGSERDDGDSSSSDDETTQMYMSQSIMSLPASASIYHSAVSLAPPPALPAFSRSFPSSSSSDDGELPPTLLSAPLTIFSTNDRISLQFISHPSSSYQNQVPSSTSPTSSDSTAAEPSTSLRPKIIMRLGVGVLAVATDSVHLRSLVDLVSFATSASPSNPSPPRSSNPAPQRPPTIRDTMEITLQVKAVVAILLLPVAEFQSPSMVPSSMNDVTEEFFAKPLLPFPISGFHASHVRAQLDHFDGTFRKELELAASGPRPLPYVLRTVAKSTLADAFVVYYSSLQSTIQPIVIFDPNLTPSSSNPPKPDPGKLAGDIEITRPANWEREGALHKLSAWRSKIGTQVRRPDVDLVDVQSPSPHAVTVNFLAGNRTPSLSTIDVAILPIHVFVNVLVVSEFMVPFLDRMAPTTPNDRRAQDTDSNPSIPDDQDIEDMEEVSAFGIPHDGPKSYETEKVLETPKPRAMELDPEVAQVPSQISVSMFDETLNQGMSVKLSFCGCIYRWSLLSSSMHPAPSSGLKSDLCPQSKTSNPFQADRDRLS